VCAYMGDYMKFTFMCRERKQGVSSRVAVIGAGPAGLSATGFLACEGYEVDVYDKLPLPGGLMLFAIPPWRIPPERVLGGVRELEEKFSVKFNNKVKVHSDASTHEEGDDFVEKILPLEDIINSYDLVLVATGTWASKTPRIPGHNAKGVYTALQYLYEWRLFELGYTTKKPPVGNRVVVIGGGYSAVDAAERSLKSGAETYLVYRRTIKEAPAGIYEIEKLKREGVEFMELVSPLEVIVESERARGVKLQKMQLGPPDESGRPAPVPIPGAEIVLEADIVIFATGEAPTPPLSARVAEKIGLQLDKSSSLLVNDLMQTRIPKVFAAGDVVHGPSRIGPAVKSGLRAARYMHNWFTTHKLTIPIQR
jgi:glutamate synthase (NADPH/NADH) small chain